MQAAGERADVDAFAMRNKTSAAAEQVTDLTPLREQAVDEAQGWSQQALEGDEEAETLRE